MSLASALPIAPAPRRLGWLAPAALIVVVFLVIPLIASDYLFEAILTPFLALSLAALGLNILTGYTGQVSLGSAAFMAVGAFAAYNFNLRLPGLPLLVSFALAGLTSAGVGLLFGLPSLRLRGFYLAVSTLAAQFFVQWALTKFGWFSNFNPSGVINVPPFTVFGLAIDSPLRRYLLSAAVVGLITAALWRLTRAQVGRDLLAVRDHETAARVIGVPVLATKLFAFALSSFVIGVAGALWAYAYLRTVEPAGFDLARSFDILFIIIIGGLASLRGAFFGAAFLVVLPLALSRLGAALFGGLFDSGIVEISQKIVIGALIIIFLILEPKGLAALFDRLGRRLRAARS